SLEPSSPHAIGASTEATSASVFQLRMGSLLPHFHERPATWSVLFRSRRSPQETGKPCTTRGKTASRRPNRAIGGPAMTETRLLYASFGRWCDLRPATYLSGACASGTRSAASQAARQFGESRARPSFGKRARGSI